MLPPIEKSTLVAKVTFLGPEVGGRHIPPGQGYRGQFFYNGMDCEAGHIFDIQDEVPFNEEITDYIFLINKNHLPNMKIGLVFLIREGVRTVGYGQIIQINKLPPSP